MPCGDSRDYETRDYEVMVSRVTLRLACDRCQEIEARGGVVPDWAQEFWVQHKKEDEQRRLTDVAAQHSHKVRQAALEKLSKEERAELGL